MSASKKTPTKATQQNIITAQSLLPMVEKSPNSIKKRRTIKLPLVDIATQTDLVVLDFSRISAQNI